MASSLTWGGGDAARGSVHPPAFPAGSVSSSALSCVGDDVCTREKLAPCHAARFSARPGGRPAVVTQPVWWAPWSQCFPSGITLGLAGSVSPSRIDTLDPASPLILGFLSRAAGDCLFLRVHKHAHGFSSERTPSYLGFIKISAKMTDPSRTRGRVWCQKQGEEGHV